MLTHLYIRNYTIISELNIDFFPGFSVITGETGAGKSIILGAIGLLKGNRADSKSIRMGQDKCLIEAHFNIDAYHLEAFFEENDLDFDANDCIIRREIASNGKSRAFINDVPASLNLLKELGEKLIDVHSQHQNLLINKEDFQLNVVDIIAQNSDMTAQFQEVYQQYRTETNKLSQLKATIIKAKENEEFLRFQFNELDNAQLNPTEQQELEQELELLTHAEDIKTALYAADHLLCNESNGALENLRNATQQIENIRKVFAHINDLADRLSSAYIEIKDISQDISNHIERIDYDPKRLEYIENRLDTLYTLQQKYHVNSVEQLVVLQNSIKQQLDSIDNSDMSCQEQQAIVNQLLDKCNHIAAQLTKTRAAAATKIEQEMHEKLVPLGIPSVQFKVEMGEKPLHSLGKDSVSFLFSGNKNSPLQPITQVASGGEISRVMLSLKAMISNTEQLPTIIFDEIDTGVSGKVAESMAKTMQQMGKTNHQVISITHLPQIAAMGEHHYSVSKTETAQGTESKMQQLLPEQRTQEIAKMLSGSSITEAALANATELLNAK